LERVDLKAIDLIAKAFLALFAMVDVIVVRCTKAPVKIVGMENLGDLGLNSLL